MVSLLEYFKNTETPNIKKVREILANNPDVDINEQKKDGFYSALHYACNDQNVEIVELLIANGADINAKNIHGYTPLHFVCRNGNEKIVEILIQNGGDVNEKDNKGETPLHTASWFSKFKVVQTIVELSTIDVTTKNNKNQTAFDVAKYYIDKTDNDTRKKQFIQIANYLEEIEKTALLNKAILQTNFEAQQFGL